MSIEKCPKDQLKGLLESWKLEILNEKLQENGFDIDSLEYIEETDLTTIFHDKEFRGPLRRFRALHSEWRKTLMPATTEGTTPVTVSLNSVEPDNGSAFNLLTALKKTEDGIKLIEYYEKVKDFSRDDRLELVRLISQYLIDIKYKMNIAKFREIANQISMVFTNEDKGIFLCKLNGRNSGLLYTGYYNQLAARTNSAKKKRSRREIEPDSEEPTENENEDEIKKAIEWMNSHNPINEEDEDEEMLQECLLENWNYSFRYRSKMIKEAGGNISEILTEWQALKNSYGFYLIEVDLKQKFGDNCDKLKDNWAVFTENNLERFKKLIDDPDVIQTLNLLSEETAESNYHNIEIVLALQHLLAPSSVVLKNKKRFRPSIPSSKKWLFQLLDCKTLIEPQIKLVKAHWQKHQLEAYPIIFGIGESKMSVSEFVLTFEDINYSFETIVEAIDAAFKCYIFFNIRFSPEHKRFWTFLNGLFYKIDSDIEITPAILSIINSLKI